MSYVFPATRATVTDPSGLAAVIANINRRIQALEAQRTTIQDGSLTGSQISEDSITSDHIQSGSIVAGHIQAGTITAAEILAGTISAELIQAGAIHAYHLAVGSVNADHISAGTVNAQHIVAGSINAEHVATGTLTAQHIQTGSLTANEIATGSLTADVISAGAIDAAHIRANAIVTEHLTADSVTADKIGVTNLTSLMTSGGWISAGQITGGLIRTATSGARAEMDAAGFRTYASNGTSITFEANAGTGIVTLTGVVYADPSSSIPAGSLTGTIPAPSMPPIGGANLLANSSAENTTTPLSGWTDYNASMAPAGVLDVFAPSTFSAVHGTRVFRAVNGTDTSGNMGVATSSNASSWPIVRPNITYTLSGYGRVLSGTDSMQMFIQWKDSADATISSSSFTSTTITSTEWTRGSVTATAPSNAVKVRVYVYIDNPLSGATYYFDAIQLEEGSVATAYSPASGEILPGVITDAMIADVGATKVTGQLTNAQIADLAAAKISGQLTNAQIADLAAAKISGQLTDSQIAALAAAKLTGQITTTQITDDAITTPKIFTGAVTADEIATNAVTATKINALAVTAGKIAANAVATNELAADAVTAVKVAAGTLTAREIAASAITAEKIAVGTLSDNLAINGSFEAVDSFVANAPASWLLAEGIGTAGTTYVSTTTDKTDGARSLQLGATSNNLAVGSKKIAVNPGDTYTLRFKVRHSDGTGTWSVRLFQAAARGTTDYLGASGVANTDTRDSYTEPLGFPATSGITSWTTQEFTYTVPAGVYFVSLAFYKWSSATGILYVDEVEFRKQLGTVHIEDGAIKAAKIYSGAVQADLVQANNVATDAIRTNHIRAGSINASKLTISPDSSVYLTNMTGADPAWSTNSIPGWSIEGAGHTWTIATDEIRTQPQSFKTVSGGTPSSLVQTATLPLGNYVHEVWVKSSALAGGSARSHLAATSGTVTGDLINSTPDTYGTPFSVTGTTDWVLIRRRFAVTSATATIKFHLYSTATSGTAWFNDVRIINAIHYTEITPGTIRSPQIAAGEIKATNIGAGEVQANHIKAGAITAQMLSVTMPGGSGVVFNNGNFTAGDVGTTIPSWTVGAGPWTVATDTIFGRKVTISNSSGTAYMTQAVTFPKGRHIISYWVKNVNTGTTSLTVTGGAGYTVAISSTVGLSDWVLKQTVLDVTSTDSGASSIRVEIVGTGQTEIANISVQSSIGATLITPGSITTNEIMAQTIRGEDIFGGTVGATYIEGGSIKAGAITADKLTVGFAGANMAVNGSFEYSAAGDTAQQFDGWLLQGSAWSTDNTPRYGERSARVITPNTTSNNYIRQDITFLAAGTYMITVWVKGTVTTLGTGGFYGVNPSVQSGSVTLTPATLPGPTAAPNAEARTATQSTWTRLHLKAVVTAATAVVRFHLQAYNIQGTFWFDGFQVEEGEVATAYTNFGPNQLVGTQITPGAITTPHISVGSITADKINFRIGTKNLLKNSGFRFRTNMASASAPTDWNPYAQSGTSLPVVQNSGGPFSSRDTSNFPAIMTSPYCNVQNATASTRTGIVQRVYDIKPAEKYSISFYGWSAHGRTITVYVDWIDSSNNIIAATQRTFTPAASWGRYSTDALGAFTAPVSSHSANVYIWFDNTVSTDTANHLGPIQFEPGERSTEWTQYIDPTVIDGDSITSAMITGGTIRTSSSSTKTELTAAANGLMIYNGGVEQLRLTAANGLEFKTGSSALRSINWKGGSAGTTDSFVIQSDTGSGGNLDASQTSLWAKSTNSSNFAQINIGVQRPGATYASAAQLFLHSSPGATPAEASVYARVSGASGLPPSMDRTIIDSAGNSSFPQLPSVQNRKIEFFAPSVGFLSNWNTYTVNIGSANFNSVTGAIYSIIAPNGASILSDHIMWYNTTQVAVAVNSTVAQVGGILMLVYGT